MIRRFCSLLFPLRRQGGDILAKGQEPALSPEMALAGPVPVCPPASRARFSDAAQFWFVAAFWVVFLPLVPCLEGCQSKDAPPPAARDGVGTPAKPSPKPAPSKPEGHVPYLKATVRELPEPNRYAVDLEWKHQSESSTVFLYRLGGSGGGLRIDIEQKEGRYIDETIQAGTLYEYLLSARGKGSNIEVLDRQAVTVPRDLEVGRMEDFDAGRGVELNRVFLKDNAVIALRERGVKLYANELVSNGAVLQSFPNGNKAPVGYHGFNAGEILISVKTARGSLKIEANGQDGGDGNDGAAGKDGAPGVPGKAGQWGMNPELYKHFFPNFVDSFKPFQERLNPPPNDPSWHYTLGNIPRFVCSSPPTDGGRGGDGMAGGDGQDGGRGGDTAQVLVEIEKPSDFDLQISGEPGLGGIGGRAGKGGAAGAGGPPGDLDRGHLCPAAKQGPPGTPGRDGRQGRTGAAGERQSVCVKNGKETKGQCPKSE